MTVLNKSTIRIRVQITSCQLPVARPNHHSKPNGPTATLSPPEKKNKLGVPRLLHLAPMANGLGAVVGAVTSGLGMLAEFRWDVLWLACVLFLSSSADGNKASADSTETVTTPLQWFACAILVAVPPLRALSRNGIFLQDFLVDTCVRRRPRRAWTRLRHDVLLALGLRDPPDVARHQD